MPLPITKKDMPTGSNTLTLANSSIEQSKSGQRLVLYWEKPGHKVVTQSWIPSLVERMKEAITALDLGDIYPEDDAMDAPALYEKIHDLVQDLRLETDHKSSTEIERDVNVTYNANDYPEINLRA